MKKFGLALSMLACMPVCAEFGEYGNEEYVKKGYRALQDDLPEIFEKQSKQSSLSKDDFLREVKKVAVNNGDVATVDKFNTKWLEVEKKDQPSNLSRIIVTSGFVGSVSFVLSILFFGGGK